MSHVTGEGVADLSGFDIREATQEGAEMRLNSPAGQPTQVVLRVRGTDSKAFQEALQARVRLEQELLPRRPNEEEKNRMFWDMHAALVVSWLPEKVIWDKGGEGLACTPANVAGALERHPWLFEQVRMFADKRANFLPGSSAG